MISNNDTQHATSEIREQWIMAGAILVYSFAFFLVILGRHLVAAFSGCSSCNLLVQTTQYVREIRNPTTSHLVGGEDDSSASQSAATSPRASRDATMTPGAISVIIDLHGQHNGHSNTIGATDILAPSLRHPNEVVSGDK